MGRWMGNMSLSPCPGVGNRPLRKKNFANPQEYSRGDGYRWNWTMHNCHVFTQKLSFRWVNISHALKVDFILLQSDSFWFQLCWDMMSDLGSEFARHGPVLLISDQLLLYLSSILGPMLVIRTMLFDKFVTGFISCIYYCWQPDN